MNNMTESKQRQGDQCTEFSECYIGRCKFCGASIMWAETTNKAKMPLDLVPHEYGHVALQLRGPTKLEPNRLPLAVIVGGWRLPEGLKLYVPHFATCTSRNDAASLKSWRAHIAKCKRRAAALMALTGKEKP